MNWKAKWIKAKRDMGDVAPIFQKKFKIRQKIERAILTITALGVYELQLNGKRVSDYVLAPGWTAYEKRLQYQQYDVTESLQDSNQIQVTVGKGWYRSRMSGGEMAHLMNCPSGLIAQLDITYADGQREVVGTDETWEVSESNVRFSEIYDGEVYDARYKEDFYENAEVFFGPSHTLIPQEGEKIIEQEVLYTSRIITTPKGEKVIDFGQEITGYVELIIETEAGGRVRLSHGEMLDKDGNFYNANYRSAKAEYLYICREGKQSYRPKLTFYGFRYVRIDEFPGGPSMARPENFRAIAVYSDIKRTGYISTSSTLLNSLMDNIVWGQKDNFLDVPTDCPQRDERLGWTGDAQLFIRAAAYNFDVEKFFQKWLNCLKEEQLQDGYVAHAIPNTLYNGKRKFDLDDPRAIYMFASTGWGDAATICPWELYMAYGNPDILRRQFQSMKKWIDYITNHTTTENLWVGGVHYGDWLGLDNMEDSYKGASRDDYIASAYYAYSTSLLIKAGKVLGEDVTKYEELYERIVTTFRDTFQTCTTQTECVIAIHFRIAKDCQKVADQLAEMIRETGHMTTGFLGTPYLLHALSDFGYADLAYELLLREEYPSWLYQVRKGATTMWEHWDGVKEDGTFWDTRMNSFNHYVYGAVIDWVYGVAAGIKPLSPGYQKARIAPIPNERLDWLKADLNTRHGLIHIEWKKQDGGFKYLIDTPVDAEIVIDSKVYDVKKGNYCFFSEGH